MSQQSLKFCGKQKLISSKAHEETDFPYWEGTQKQCPGLLRGSGFYMFGNGMSSLFTWNGLVWAIQGDWIIKEREIGSCPGIPPCGVFESPAKQTLLDKETACQVSVLERDKKQ